MNKPGIDRNQSMALKLNWKMFREQFSSFLAIDVLLIFLLFIGSMIYMENTASKIVDDMDTIKPQSNAGNGYDGATDSANKIDRRNLQIGNYNVTFSQEAPNDTRVHRQLWRFLPDNTESAYRYFTRDDEKSGFVDNLRSIEYHVTMPMNNDNYMNISLYIGLFYYFAFNCLIIIVIIQILMLISTAISTRRAITTALEPLRELSQATQAFSDAANNPSGQYSPEALENLAHALNTINVSHLDTRIPSHLMTEELRPLAAAINEMLNRINESYDSQIRFVSDASHELRTPIAVIQGYADLLSRWGTEDEETLKESINAIQSEAESMKQLVNQLLFLARGDTDSMKLDLKTLNLSDIVSEIVKEFDMIDKIHDIEANINPGVKIEGDQGLIKQLLRILTDNSIKYTPDGGKITIKLMADDKARIIIQDEGRGIPEDLLPHIFDRFVRADESRTRDTGGAGLGLSIGKWITEKHDGHLEVLSREGIGTRFTVVLPLIDERPVPVSS